MTQPERSVLGFNGSVQAREKGRPLATQGGVHADEKARRQTGAVIEQIRFRRDPVALIHVARCLTS